MQNLPPLLVPSNYKERILQAVRAEARSPTRRTSKKKLVRVIGSQQVRPGLRQFVRDNKIG